MSSLDVRPLLVQSPALRSFALSCCSGFLTHPESTILCERALTSLILKDVAFITFPRLPPTLKRLVLQSSRPLYLPRGPTMFRSHWEQASWNQAIQSYLPELTHLSLREMVDLTPEFFEALLDIYSDDNGGELKRIEEDQRTPLQHLSLAVLPHASSLFGAGGLLSSPRILTQSLTSLDIAALPCTDDDVEALLGHPTSLQSIDLSSTKVTGAGVKMLVDGLPGLRVLKVDNCRHISSRDAIAYAERKGVAVSCQMGDSFGGARKVRYG